MILRIIASSCCSFLLPFFFFTGQVVYSLPKQLSDDSHQKYCRNIQSLKQLPWTINSSTFYNLGYPLLHTLCAESSAYRGGSHRNLAFGVTIFCGQQRKRRKRIYHETRAGDLASTIIVEPPGKDHGGDTSGFFAINSIYSTLFQRGYKVRTHHFSSGPAGSFPSWVVQRGLEDNRLWDIYASGVGNGGSGNPYKNDTDDYIRFQGESGNSLWGEEIPEVSNNTYQYARDIRWVIGLHKRLYSPEYISDRHHCVGANFYLGESLRCAASSSVIMAPMYAFHRQASRSAAARSEGSSGVKAKKENLVLVDSDARHSFPVDQLQANLRKKGLAGFKKYFQITEGSVFILSSLCIDVDAVVLVHTGRKKKDVPKLYRRVKVTLDCNNPGVEFINYEATLYDCLTLSCDARATHNVFDFPVPSKYHVDPMNLSRVTDLVYDCLVNYQARLPDFAAFKTLSKSSHSLAGYQLDIHLFARDVLFRTFCSDYTECRSVLPWALSVWTLFPFSRIEIFTALDTNSFMLENDLIISSLPDSFNPRYWRVMKWPGSDGLEYTSPANVLPSFPCSHIVFMKAGFILFGRDFINEHLFALGDDERPYRPIVHREVAEGGIAIAFMRNFRPPEYRTLMCCRSAEVFFVYEGERSSMSWEAYVNVMNTDRRAQYVNKTAMDSIPLRRSPLSTKDILRIINNNAAQMDGPSHARHKTNTSEGHDAISDGLAIDSIYFPSPRDHASHAVTMIWLTSDTRVSLDDFYEHASRSERRALVTHLDPLLQSAFFRRTLAYFPQHIGRPLTRLSAVHFPEVISLLDAYHAHWSDSSSPC